jgi:hypothetical protein
VRSHAVRARLLTIAAALAVLALPAAEAVAGTGYGQLIVNPGTVTAGQTVTILGTCPNNGQPFDGVESSAFAGGKASVDKGSVNFTGSATISSSLAPGTYTVTAQCGSGSPSVNITVAAAGSAPTTQAAAAQPSSGSVQGQSAAAAPQAQSSTAAAAGAAGAPATPSANASTPASSQSAQAGASDAAVTSTGIVRVGLAGNTKPLLSASLVESFVALVAASGAVGFLMFQRRRKSHTHNS